MSIQRAFLRVLEERSFRPVGARHELQSDFRLIAATNRNLDEMAQLGLFRSDLLYRLQGLNIALPPLRERMQDLMVLLTYFMDDHCLRRNICSKEVADDFIETLRAYPWPGNVRELSHAVDRALAAAAMQPTLFRRPSAPGSPCPRHAQHHGRARAAAPRRVAHRKPRPTRTPIPRSRNSAHATNASTCSDSCGT